jgi:hypothetical protein
MNRIKGDEAQAAGMEYVTERSLVDDVEETVPNIEIISA